MISKCFGEFLYCLPAILCSAHFVTRSSLQCLPELPIRLEAFLQDYQRAFPSQISSQLGSKALLPLFFAVNNLSLCVDSR